MKRGGPYPYPPLRTRGFALLVTLALVAIVSIIVVSFLNATLSGRRDSHATTNITQSVQAVQAASNVGIHTLCVALTQFPDSATFWDRFGDTEGTLLYYRPHPTPGVQPGTPPMRLPLCSGARPQAVDSSEALLVVPHPSLPFEHADNSVDLNQARFPGDTQGWIGSPGTDRLPLRVPWVEMHDPDAPSRVIGRYAWWIEDESFKLDLNHLGANPRGGGPGLDPAELPLQVVLSEVLSSTDATKLAQEIVALRSRYPAGAFPEVRLLNHLKPGLGEQLRFYLSPHTSALNLSRAGMQRVNLNTLTEPSSDPAAVRAQLDALLAPIRQQLPSFGQRFYRLEADDRNNDAGVPEEHAEIYLQKLAANLRDYLTPGSQPTVVLADGSVMLGSEPIAAIAPAPGLLENPVIAFGKKNVPYLQEYAARVRLHAFTPNKGSAVSSYFSFSLHHYFEFWNMGTRDLSVANGDLGVDPFLLIHNLPGFDTGQYGTPINSGGSVRIPLPSNLVFPAGKITVLTTEDPSNVHLVRAPERVSHIGTPPSLTYSGQTRLKTSGNEFRVNLIPRSSSATDYETKMLLGNNDGILESFCALPLARGAGGSSSIALQIHNNDQGTIRDLIIGSQKDFYLVRGGSLHGNTEYPTITGDPRTNNEQLHLRTYSTSGDEEQTRFYNSSLDNPSGSGVINVPAQSTVGLHNFNYVNPLLWPDPFLPSNNEINAPMYVAQGPMQSIGELGHLFDPAREVGPSGNIHYSRGGGRTLNIGQPDPLWDGDPASNSREWAAWRLCDIFTTHDNLRLPGRINPNGLLRDDGVAVRTLLHGYTFLNSVDGDPRLAGQPINPILVNELIKALGARLSTLGPLAERGELSELRLPDAVKAGRENLYDRGREELFRRLVELTTTRGSTFTFYAVGQSLAQGTSGRRTVTATSRLKITFELIPVWTSDTPATRHSQPPDRFAVKILAASGH